MGRVTSPSKTISTRSLVSVVVTLVALATSLALFFSLGAQQAIAKEEATSAKAAEGTTNDQQTEAAKNAIIQRSPSAINFGTVNVGSFADRTVTVTGVSQGCLFTIGSTCISPLFGGGIDVPSISGPNAGNFSIVQNHCTGATLDPGQSCGITVRFSPNNAQNFNATLNIPPHLNGHTSFGGDSSVALSGTGFIPPVINDPPVVTSASPTGRNVSPGANATATFSEAMSPATINAGTFTLTKKGSSVQVDALVSYDAGAKKATLNPNAKLKRGAIYTARVTTGAKDLAGLSLDQDSVTPGSQPKTWSFRVKP